MPDIYGKYTLTEVAKELNVPAPFINRIQNETEIGGKVGSKGKTVVFDEYMLRTFRVVKMLRLMDFPFPQIKEIWAIEERLLKEEKKTELDPAECPMELILHSYVCPDLYLAYSGSFTGEEDPKNELSKLLKENHKQYFKLQNQLLDIKREVERRRKIFLEDIAKLDGELKRRLLHNYR